MTKCLIRLGRFLADRSQIDHKFFFVSDPNLVAWGNKTTVVACLTANTILSIIVV